MGKIRKALHDNFTVPNLITLFRLILAPVAIYIMIVYPDSYWIAGIILIIAGISDVLDGHLARASGQVSTLGTMLDPVADKLLMMGVLIVLAAREQVNRIIIELLIVKELALLLGGLMLWKKVKRAIPASWLGKGATVLLYIGVLSLLFGIESLYGIFIYSGVALSVIAGLHYLYLAITG
ncbi:MAG: CDP-alcohol phosphatidyltransferase family protein [Firmicutes bacterium]|nr:CDP-alcohol phosphatidyltransferase family protein [Bacillota bacterium]MDD4264151.1 CDP-alcohol phosphatidyltransferase family protein [Bacillota bacterium]MDD4693978.1 CDP-alcohol phosphatidyltransferase family protein [Bacillota bacterium]